MRRAFLVAAATAALALSIGLAAPASAQELTIGRIMQGSTSSNAPGVFRFNAETAGVLTVVVRGKGDADLYLIITDSIGQQVPDGRSDQDLQGDSGAEQASVTLRNPGNYQVQVLAYSGSATFDIAAGWISFPSLAGPVDPDALPTAARPLMPGTPVDDAIDPSAGDLWDWYKVTVQGAAVITVITEAPEGDLALEVYAEGKFGELVERSDQDIQGVTGNESLTVRAAAGETYYFKVAPAFDTSNRIAYKIRVGVM